VRRDNKPVFALKRYPACLLLISALFLLVTNLNAQDLPTKPTRQSSLEAFSKGNYEQAYREFSELLNTYPKDPMYKYYSGVCLVKLKREPEKAVTLLGQAQKGSAIVRTIPSDALFWLGRAQQMSGKFEDAIASYNNFIDLNGKKTSRELGIPDFIEQCERREGFLTEDNAVITVEEDEPGIGKEGKSIIKLEEKVMMISEQEDTLSGNYDEMLSEAIEYQYKADSLYRIAEEQKKELEKGSYAERTKLKAEIAETEKLAASFQDLADKKYNEAQTVMNSKPFTEGLVARQIIPLATDSSLKREKLSDSLINNFNSGETIDSITTAKDSVRTETIKKTADIKPVADTVTLNDVKKDILPETVKKSEVYYIFEIKQNAENEKIPIDPEVPEGLLYRIQVAVFRNPVAPSYFKGITPVYGFKMTGRDLTIYYAGMFRRLTDANKALGTVRQKGFRDAFVSAFFNSKAVSSERAAALENKWGKIPLSGVSAEEQVPVDTVPPTLTFRIEIARSQKPVRDDDLETYKKLSGTRGLDIITLPDGNIVYLVGHFITWESAVEYADLLVRNGYSDAKVGAWLGEKEIPVETARELFDMLE